MRKPLGKPLFFEWRGQGPNFWGVSLCFWRVREVLLEFIRYVGWIPIGAKTSFDLTLARTDEIIEYLASGWITE
jgi:hypothetical protein